MSGEILEQYDLVDEDVAKVEAEQAIAQIRQESADLKSKIEIVNPRQEFAKFIYESLTFEQRYKFLDVDEDTANTMTTRETIRAIKKKIKTLSAKNEPNDMIVQFITDQKSKFNNGTQGKNLLIQKSIFQQQFLSSIQGVESPKAYAEILDKLSNLQTIKGDLDNISSANKNTEAIIGGKKVKIQDFYNIYFTENTDQTGIQSIFGSNLNISNMSDKSAWNTKYTENIVNLEKGYRAFKDVFDTDENHTISTTDLNENKIENSIGHIDENQKKAILELVQKKSVGNVNIGGQTYCARTAYLDAKNIFGLNLTRGNARDLMIQNPPQNDKLAKSVVNNKLADIYDRELADRGTQKRYPINGKMVVREALQVSQKLDKDSNPNKQDISSNQKLLDSISDTADFADLYVNANPGNHNKITDTRRLIGHRATMFRLGDERFVIDPYRGNNKYGYNQKSTPVPYDDYVGHLSPKNDIIKANFYKTGTFGAKQTA